MMKQSFMITTCLALVASVNSAQHRFISSTFVPPAVPSVVSSAPAPVDIAKVRQRAIATGYIVPAATDVRRGGPLYAKKKAPPAKKKVQVKLLKYVEGIGSIGEVVMVAPAFFENKLKRSGSGVLISDEDVQKETSEKEAKAKAQLELATDLKAKIEEINL
eukprot:13022192-Ditylum_brightwellii.AAC.1